jgi:hypothetical protein
LTSFGHGNPLTESQVLEIIRTVARAMSELQSQHQLHNPLAPQDVLIDARGNIRLSNLASLRPDTRIPVQAQIESLGEALELAVGVAGIRAGVLKRLFRRIQRPGTDQISTWAGLRKAAEGISPNALASGELSDEHTSFIVNLVPDRPTLGIFKISAAAAAAGVLVGTLVWGTGRLGSANARESNVPGSLLAAEITPTNQEPASMVILDSGPLTNVPPAGPLVYGSIGQAFESTATETGDGVLKD